MRDALTAPVADVLAAAPERTAVLGAVGLVERDGDELPPHPSLRDRPGPSAPSAVAARLSSLRQAVAAAAREGTALTNDGWAGQDDEVLLTQVVGIDIVDRVLELARRELAAAGEAADRVTVRRQDVAELTAPAAYDLVGLAAPFLSEAALDAALRRLIDALRPGGWIVLGTNRRRRTRCCWPSLAGRPS